MKKAEYLDKWWKLQTTKEEITHLMDKVVQMERELGLDRIEDQGHVQGSNMTYYMCLDCGTSYMSAFKGICGKCHPFEDDAT